MPIRPTAIAATLLLAACAVPQDPLTLPPATIAADCPQPAPVTTTEPPHTAPSAAVKASSAYSGLQQREARAVTSPAASAGYVRAIHSADDLARAALKALIAEDGKPTDRSIKAARDSIDHLIQTLETTEGGGSM
jgi:hypothetical protein